MLQFKYRIDFYYWNRGKGFSHIETFDQFYQYCDAKTYLEETDIDTSDMDCDAIWVKVIDNENDYPLSEYWWDDIKKGE